MNHVVDELAARLAVVEARLGITPPAVPGDPTPTPTGRSATPPRPDIALSKASTDVTWPPATPGTPPVARWNVRDELNTAAPAKGSVTEPRYVGSPMKLGSPPRRYSVQAVGVDGQTSDWSPAVDVPATGLAPAPSTIDPTPPADGARYPYDVIGGNWYLTLPTGNPGKPDTVELPDLATFANEFFRLTEARDGVEFTARCGGVTTKNSKYPRSELRQTDNGKMAAWSNRGAGQTLIVEEAFTRLPVAKPECVGAQIHDARDDVILLHLSGRRLTVRWDDGKRQLVLDEDYQLGTRFRVEIAAAHGKIAVAYNGQHKGEIPLTGDDWWWKVGCYVQSNSSKGDKPDAAGQVIVYLATVVDGAA